MQLCYGRFQTKAVSIHSIPGDNRQIRFVHFVSGWWPVPSSISLFAWARRLVGSVYLSSPRSMPIHCKLNIRITYGRHFDLRRSTAIPLVHC